MVTALLPRNSEAAWGGQAPEVEGFPSDLATTEGGGRDSWVVAMEKIWKERTGVDTGQRAVYPELEQPQANPPTPERRKLLAIAAAFVGTTALSMALVAGLGIASESAKVGRTGSISVGDAPVSPPSYGAGSTPPPLRPMAVTDLAAPQVG